MNLSILKAQAIISLCAGKVDIIRSPIGGIIGDTALEIYKNLVRADECKLSDPFERTERQRFQREAIVGCRVLTGLFNSVCSGETKKYLCKHTDEVRRLTAAWLNAEKRQAVQKGARNEDGI